jgi:nucleoside-diphosphate-sugar epimerase
MIRGKSELCKALIAVDGSLIQKELGFVPQYDLKTGWKETIREMRGENSFK